MGVILTTAIVFGIIAAILELRLALKIPIIRKLVERFSVVGIGFSIGLSLLLGMLFGAAGMIVMFAAILATTLTQPVYVFLNKTKKQTSKTKQQVEDFKATWRPVGKLIKYAFLLVTAPLWVPVKIRNWWLDNSQPTTSDDKERSNVANDYVHAS